MDLIERQDAIDAVEKGILAWSHMPKWREEKIIENVKAVPPAPQWIPISERMPEEGKTVLGTFEFQDGKGCMTTERIIVKGKEIWSAACGMVPIAWIPLPEPYKESEE